MYTLVIRSAVSLMKFLTLIFIFIFFIYLILPSSDFPEPPADALRSNEPADTEDPFRRAYFTNLSRDEVLKHYEYQFSGKCFLGMHWPSYRLNYPPEESQTIIRDQTRSTYLEEIVHPFRESVYINGFEPKDQKDAINIEGRDWDQKIIVRFVPSKPFVRVAVGLLTVVAGALVLVGWRSIFIEAGKIIKKWTSR